MAFHRSRRPAFSLLEVIMALALMALLLAAVAISVTPLLRGLGEEAVPEVLRQAVREARYQAALHKEDRLLRFDPETSAFVIENDGGSETGRFETAYDENDPNLVVAFLAIPPGRDLPDRAPEPQPVEVSYVRFGADRSANPFFVRVIETGFESEHRYDTLSYLEVAHAET